MNSIITNKVTRVISVYIIFISSLMLLSYFFNVIFNKSHLNYFTLLLIIVLLLFSIYILKKDNIFNTNLPNLYISFLLLCNIYYVFYWLGSNKLSYLISGFIMILSCVICSNFVFQVVCSLLILINIFESILESGNVGDITIRFLFFSLIYFVSSIFRHELISSFNTNIATTKKLTELISEQDELIERKILEYNRDNQRIIHLGRLSNSVIHDINSYITTLDVSNVHVESQRMYFQNMENTFNKIKSSINELRMQNRQNMVNEEFKIVFAVNDTLKLGNFFAKNNVDLRIIIDPDITIIGNKYYFKFIILNLVLNAVESMHNRKERVLIISCKVDDCDIIIKIKDSGIGISDFDVENIFKPFYTTKSNNLGIGLYLVKKYIEEEFNGSIVCKSKYNVGTTFEIRLNKRICPSSKS